MRFTCPEEEVLIRGTALQLRPADADRLQYLFAHEAIDWGRVLRLAQLNRVTSLPHTNLNQIPSSDVPEPVKAQLQATHFNNTLHSLRLKAELIRVLKAFEERDIPVMPLKGPVLAELYYGNLSLRESGDLDVLVHPRSFRAAESLLAGLGYHFPDGASGILKNGHHVHVQNPSSGITLELHWKLADRRYARYRDGDWLWQGAVLVPFGNSDVLVPRPENLLIFLAVHAFRHYWCLLRWINDFAVIQGRTDLDWDFLAQQAADLRATRILWMSLLLSSEIQQMELPEYVSREFVGQRATRRALERISEGLVSESGGRGAPDYMPQWRFPLQDSSQDILRLIRFLPRDLPKYLKPNVRDFDWLPLPRYLYPLYFLIRPIRLATERLPKRGRSLMQRHS